MYEARDLELRALMAPSDLPPELQMQPVDYEMIRKAQEEDPECSGLRAKLQSGDKRVSWWSDPVPWDPEKHHGQWCGP